LNCVKETDDHEKADLEKELNKIEVTKHAMALSKPNKSPGEDEFIGCFYQLYWEVMKKNEFIQLLNEIFTENTLCESQCRGEGPSWS
jgi:hypothetical protein